MLSDENKIGQKENSYLNKALTNALVLNGVLSTVTWQVLSTVTWQLLSTITWQVLSTLTWQVQTR